MKLFVRSSPVHGKGVFAGQDIRKGSRIIEYVGEKIDNAEADRREKENDTHSVTYIFILNNHTCIDGAVDGNISRFVNHSCDPNCYYKTVGDHLYYFAKHDIRNGEELCIDYAYDRDSIPVVCHCGSSICRGFINEPSLIYSVWMKMRPLLKKPLVRIGAIIAGIFLVMMIAAVLFIKFDTAAAAEFTDNYLRPLLGPQIVVGLEKIFYNLSDAVKRHTYTLQSGGEFQFLDETGTQNLNGSRLSLNSIPMESGFTPQKDEGVWKDRRLTIFPNKEVMAYTFVRPDPQRAFAYVTLIQMDMKELRISAVAGTKQPGGAVGMAGPGVVPSDLIASGKLVAAFDGGFQYRDGQYGMIVGDTTYLPLKQDMATLVGYTDGTLKLFPYTGQNLGKNVVFVRQNCPMLIQDGKIVTSDLVNRKLWGRTLTAAIFTWRSGLGITKEGNLIFAVGNNLTPETLAVALKMGGAVNAMQLDINPYWVRFNIFNSLGNGEYKTSTLTKDIKDGSQQYLHGYTKDFFYVFKK